MTAFIEGFAEAKAENTGWNDRTNWERSAPQKKKQQEQKVDAIGCHFARRKRSERLKRNKRRAISFFFFNPLVAGIIGPFEISLYSLYSEV